jgi:bifunctional DNA-binding transcriptional regulator/antitoxin component of YhaV-PrlF toxin-antitoxin module
MQKARSKSKQISGTITSRGQVTIPAEIRRILGADTPGKIIFQLDGDEVRLLRPAFTLETAYGSVEPLNRPEDFPRIAREARKARVEDLHHTVEDQ